MSEASSDLHPQPVLPALPRRRPRTDGRFAPAEPGSAKGLQPETREPEDGYPLDPPLVDVRIPVRAPHATATTYSRDALMERFPDAEVGDDLHILFREKGKERKKAKRTKGKSRLSPDVLVALNVPRRSTRADYDVDELGPPDFVLEVLSRSTWKHDIGRKLKAYEAIGVRECLLFDVTGENLAGVGRDLWGFSLTPEGREPLEERVLPNGERGVCSAVLGLVAYVAVRKPPAAHNETWALTMRWHDQATGQDLPDYHQSRKGRRGRGPARSGRWRARRGRWPSHRRRELVRMRRKRARTPRKTVRTRRRGQNRLLSAGSRNWKRGLGCVAGLDRETAADRGAASADTPSRASDVRSQFRLPPSVAGASGSACPVAAPLPDPPACRACRAEPSAGEREGAPLA